MIFKRVNVIYCKKIFFFTGTHNIVSKKISYARKMIENYQESEQYVPGIYTSFSNFKID